MKQKIITDSNYNEIEYIELDDNDNVLFRRYTHYYYDNEKGCFSNNIFEITDSNGWVRMYDKKGKLTSEKNA